MKNLKVVIVHYIPGRIRMRLLRSPRNINDFIEKIKSHDGIEEVTFNHVTSSLLVKYRPAVVSSMEIVVRASILISLDYDSRPVVLEHQNRESHMGNLDYYAAFSLVAAVISNSISKESALTNYLKINGTYSTLFAVLSHAFKEVKRDGVYDPEVISSVYLINSIIKGNMLFPSVATWLISFGRHIISPPDELAQIEAISVIDSKNKEFIEVSAKPVLNNNLDNNPINLMLIIFGKIVGVNINKNETDIMSQIAQVARKHGNVLEGIGNNERSVYLRLAK